jgi:CO/xanthine dehydrogenase Mo-binding subunit
MDELAGKLGMDPLELRRRNALREGDETITGHRLTSSVGFIDVLDRVAQSADWQRKREAYALSSDPLRKGIGLAACYYGVGLGAMGKQLNPAGANLVVSADGSVTVAVGTTEIGQGMVTVLTQITADALGCPPDLVHVMEADTSRVPDSGPTVASRTTVMSGNAIRDAAAKIRAAMAPVIADSGLSWKDAVALCVQKQVGLAAHGWAVPPSTTFDLATGQGEAYICYSFSANIVEVEVDTRPARPRPARPLRPRHRPRHQPHHGEGQVEGGVVQGLGYALVEEHATEGRPHPQRPVLDLHHPHDTRHAGDPLDPGRARVPVGPVRRQGPGRDPDHRGGAGGHERHPPRRGVRLSEIPATPERVWAALRARGGSPTTDRT